MIFWYSESDTEKNGAVKRTTKERHSENEE